MSFSVTALNLVNRVNRRRRQQDVASFVNPQELATLDAVNSAITEVLNAREWEFDIRNTQIITAPRLTSQTISGGSGNASLTLTSSGLTGSDFDNRIARLVLKGQSGYGNTAIRCSTYTSVLASLVFSTPVAIEDAVSTTTGEIFFAEYLLGDTVKSVIRANYQENDLTLRSLGATIEFAEAVPRWQVDTGEPRILSVGGLDIPTYSALGSVPDPSLRMIVWPVPDDEYVIDYTYLYRHPELTDTTDTLEGVPPEVVDMIVDMATADMKADYDLLNNEGRALRRDSMETLESIHARHGGTHAQRSAVGNWDGYGLSKEHRYSITRGRQIG